MVILTPLMGLWIHEAGFQDDRRAPIAPAVWLLRQQRVLNGIIPRDIEQTACQFIKLLIFNNLKFYADARGKFPPTCRPTSGE
ncbi:hypothetical protein, partial [Aromatoleum diolicum]|uniref:hypothetical protein n=1 Tax=Aromatoleum diolicum TaxID=75796 RepID=UPI001B7D1799